MKDARVISEQIDGLARRYAVALEATEVASAIDQQLAALGHTAQIRGFRPGRAPMSRLRAHYGSRVRDEVIDRMAIGVARRLIADNQLLPARRPTIHVHDQPGSAETVEFTLLLETSPVVTLDAMEGLRLKHLQAIDQDPLLEQQAGALLRRELFDALMARYDFPVPTDMVNDETLRISRGFAVEVGEAVDAVVAAELREIAERRIRLAILLTQIGRAHDIRVPPEDVALLVQQQAQREPDHEQEVIDYYIDHPSALAELQSARFEDLVVNFLLQRSEIEEVVLGAEELRAALEQP